MWEFLIYSMPWWLQLAIVAVVAAALFLLAVRVLGWERVKDDHAGSHRDRRRGSSIPFSPAGMGR